MAAPARGEIQLTLALLKPTVVSYQPDVSAILRHIKKSGLDVSSDIGKRFPSEVLMY